MQLTVGRAGCALAAVLGMGLTCACCHSLEPIVHVRPLLSVVNVDDFTSSFVDWGLVAVSGLPADTSYRLGSREQIPVSITASGGDTESVELSSLACGEPPAVYACHELELEMDSGYQAQQLRPSMDQIPARFILVSVSGRVAGIWVFDEARVNDAIAILARQPGVKYVGLALLGAAGGGGSVSPELEGAAPLDFAPVIPRDGHLQARTGDTLTVAYDQANGTQLKSQFVVP